MLEQSWKFGNLRPGTSATISRSEVSTNYALPHKLYMSQRSERAQLWSCTINNVQTKVYRSHFEVGMRKTAYFQRLEKLFT